MSQGAGQLIALECVDEVMLEAQAQQLYRWLHGRGVAIELTGEPTYGPVGAQIRLARQGRLQVDPASLALWETADRMDHLGQENGILSWLAAGRHVLCARYLLFSYACHLDHVELDWLQRINARCRRPDLTLFLDVDPAGGEGGERVRMERKGGKGEEAERLRRNYLAVIADARIRDALRGQPDMSEGEGAGRCGPADQYGSIVIVDAGAPADQAFEACRRQVASLLEL